RLEGRARARTRRRGDLREPRAPRCRGARALPRAGTRHPRSARGDLLARPAVVGLAARAALDPLAEDEGLGQLVARDVLLGLGEEIGLAGARALAQLHDRDDLLAPALARAPGDDAVVDLGVLLQRVFDLLGEDLLAAGVDRDGVATEHLDH